MKIYIALFENTALDSSNPFVRTLENAIVDAHNEVSFSSMKTDFWTDAIFDYDIVHIMWPNCFASAMRQGANLQERLNTLKFHGVKIVATCHNLVPHLSVDEYDKLSYKIVYRSADVIIHLGRYSKSLFEEQYSNIKHVIIPHHVYDQIYTAIPNKEEALTHLHLKNAVYAICFGLFRHPEEKTILLQAVKTTPNIKYIANRFLDIPKGKIDKRWFRQRLKWVYYKLKYPNLILTGENFVTEEDLVYYYAVSDISFIQRLDTLNSGNVFLGMLMGNVIVGPDAGNTGEILTQSGNYVFQPHQISSVTSAMLSALSSVKQEKGLQNKNYALNNWSTKKIAEMHYQLYKSICNSH